jgi:hypothetical protein
MRSGQGQCFCLFGQLQGKEPRSEDLGKERGSVHGVSSGLGSLVRTGHFAPESAQ